MAAPMGVFFLRVGNFNSFSGSNVFPANRPDSPRSSQPKKIISQP